MSRRHEIRQLLERLTADGWSIERRRSSHLKAVHAKASRPLWIPATPSGTRTFANKTAEARRLLRPTT